MDNQKKSHARGMLAALGCAVIWGILPIYWKRLKPIDSMLLICYRMILVSITTFVISYISVGRKRLLQPLRDKKKMLTFFISGLIIGLNWSVYIWAVNANYIIQTCIGYYIEPLVVCFMGIIIFKEKLNKYKIVAMALAIVGVLIVLVHFHQIPIIAVGLASTFAVYAGIKKKFKNDPLVSLFYETLLVTPVALIGILYFNQSGEGILEVATSNQIILLSLAGIVTAIPLSLFGIAANKISMIELGVTEYISPSLSLIIGIFVFNEYFDKVQLGAFVFIWIGLIYFTYGEIKEAR